MTQEQLDALNAANGTQTITYTHLDQEALYKLTSGDWGNNYGHIIAQEETSQTVTVELIGQGVTIDADRTALVAVPFIGA